MRKVIIGLLAMAAALSCTHKMDPYVGGDGLRANINSQKCVMRGTSGSKAYSTYTKQSSSATWTVQKVSLVKLSYNDGYEFSLTIQDTPDIVVGKSYTMDGTTCKASLTRILYEDQKTSSFSSTGTPVPLSGQVVITAKDGDRIQATFSLDGSSSEGNYVVRHGFLRLLTSDQ